MGRKLFLAFGEQTFYREGERRYRGPWHFLLAKVVSWTYNILVVQLLIFFAGELGVPVQLGPFDAKRLVIASVVVGGLFALINLVWVEYCFRQKNETES